MTTSISTDFNSWIQATSVALYLLGLLYMIFSNRSKATKKEIEKVDLKHAGTFEKIGDEIADHRERITSHGTRLTAVETTVKHIPNKDDYETLHQRIGKVQESVNGVSKEVAATDAHLKEIAKNVDLLVSYHMSGEKK
ncbi:MAG: DUF2730 family protein [Rhodospirillales bacterium]